MLFLHMFVLERLVPHTLSAWKGTMFKGIFLKEHRVTFESRIQQKSNNQTNKQTQQTEQTHKQKGKKRPSRSVIISWSILLNLYLNEYLFYDKKKKKQSKFTSSTLVIVFLIVLTMTLVKCSPALLCVALRVPSGTGTVRRRTPFSSAIYS